MHGSFNKFLNKIEGAITTLNSTGVAEAIAPHNCEAVDSQDGFVLLAGEQGEDPRLVEAKYLQHVLKLKALGGFSLYITPNGYIGNTAAYEAGIVHATGTRVFFTERPRDVSFYVHGANIKSVDQLAEELHQNDGVLPPFEPDANPVADTWDRLLFPTALVAVGGIVTHGDRVLVVEDGRWRDEQLTVPGTTVRARETTDAALRRALTSKFGLDTESVQPFRTSFMLGDSGYGKPTDNLVFDDRLIGTSSQRVRPQDGITTHWLSRQELKTLLDAGQIEPNAAALLQQYLATTPA